ncbi:SusE domain-containing protein [Hyunsoonleella rubra]|uniref:SusE domain-containing protein n=1 Tax=Hyunsoonleella rubra TaxID=1737062 RepID=A0ABW5T7X0_9FLAO
MKILTNKISFLFLSLALIFTACETEETLVITSPDPAFTLQQPGISSVFLNFGTPDNAALSIAWNDEVTGSSSYDVEMSLDADFTSTVNLGNVSSNSFSISVTDLNNAIRDAGAANFRDVAVYFRINAGGTLSNSVLYLVTTYPTDAPMMSSPSNNDAFVLALANSGETAMTIDWEDAVLSSTLGIEVIYTVEAAAAGTDFAVPVTVGTVTNGTTLSVTNSDLNAVAIGLGLAPDTAGNVDMRIIARNTNQNGNTLERVSDTTTVSITPYNVSFPYLYMVGDATTPGWSNDNNNTPIFRDQDVPNGYFFTGYFGAGAFKLLEVKGQWQPQWGTNDGSTLAVNPGGGSDPGTFNVGAAGYYTYTFTTVGEGGSFTVTPYDASGAPTYGTIGIIGDATPGGWGSDTDFTQDPNNPHLWYLNGVTLTNGGQMLIRANDDWADVWRYTGSSELYGTSVLAGGGDNIPFNAPTGTYDVWFNDLDGAYVIIPN